METHSSILAWKIPWTEEPGRLLSMKESDMTDPHSPQECRLEGELQASWHLVEGGLRFCRGDVWSQRQGAFPEDLRQTAAPGWVHEV